VTSESTAVYPIISADSHFTEPADLWINYIEPAYRDRAPHVEHQADTDVFVCDTGSMFTVGVIHGVRYKGGDVVHEGRYSDIPASGWDPHARLKELAIDGVDAEVLYPTIAMRFFTIEDIPFGNACIRAYNSFAADFCRSVPDRFRAVGVIMLDDIPAAVAELERCRDLGLRGAMIAVYPDSSKPYHDPEYDPFWQAAERLGLPVSLHVSTERRVRAPQSPTEDFLAYTVVQRIIIGMIYAGTFDRFPELKVVSVENDAGWAGNLIERMDYFHSKARARNLKTGQQNQRDPSEYWRRNVYYTFMRDRTALLAREVIGVDRLLWASDFPHGDSTWPESQAAIEEQFADIPMEDRRKILHDNAAELYGFGPIEPVGNGTDAAG
jgi:predicted TIM-barrel fold metal-dependent hydrolase